jgi:hypothetical protein
MQTRSVGPRPRHSDVDFAITPKPADEKRGRVINARRTERNIAHGVDDDALVALRVLCDAAQARLHHMVAVEVGQLGGRLDPELVLHVRRGEGGSDCVPWRTVP